MMDITQALWAKKSTDLTQEKWLPLPVHMRDTAEIAKLLWELWLPHSVRTCIASGVHIDGVKAGLDVSAMLLYFLAYIHDVGKAIPIFQVKSDYITQNISETLRRGLEISGFPLDKRGYGGKKQTKHGIVSHIILRRHGFDDSVAVVAGGHHGLPPSVGQLRELEKDEKGIYAFGKACGFDEPIWLEAQDCLLEQAFLLSGLDREKIKTITLSREAQVLLTGLIILADWIASDADNMPLIPIGTYKIQDPKTRAWEAFETLKLPYKWSPEWDPEGLYLHRFGYEQTRPMQDTLVETVRNCLKPGIFVVEAPMGEGKTEAALVAAELLASRMHCRGIYFALPSQATSNAMFDRVVSWIDTFAVDDKFSVMLAHGKADIYQRYSDIKNKNRSDNAIELSADVNLEEEDEGSSVTVHEWLSGRKKGMLTDFAIGTIDQVLMTALKQKHLVLRHLGLAGKVVIMDEIHSFDTYMERYLLKTLNWLGAYGVPVIVLSATLPSARRRDVVNAYLNVRPIRKKEPVPFALSKKNTYTDSAAENDPFELKNNAYPLITYTDGTSVKFTEVRGAERGMEVELHRIDENTLVETLKTVLIEGGCAGVIVNTVRKSQRLYDKLKGGEFGDYVHLLHSRFLASDRREKEEQLTKWLGKGDETQRPDKLIIVGTQVFEQSLDIDFDVIVTDLCPMDLLLQRIGRMHRHKREQRPAPVSKAVCYVMGTEWGQFDSGSEVVYGRYILMRSNAVLPGRAVLPGDIPQLVAGAYDEDSKVSPPDEMQGEYEEARRVWDFENKKRVRRAKAFQISEPKIRETLVDWLNMSAEDTEAQGEATVRDGTDSLEVTVIQKRGDELFLLPWISGGQILPRSKPDNQLAKTIYSCTVRLPSSFGKWNIEDAIKKLEEDMVDEGLVEGWYQSRWLKGVLCLILDEAQEASICGYKLRYDRERGLLTEKEEKNG
ncbi:MAG: CRISPR-associated helicase Cas3' [Oscillospiraceae bacterium]|jgi:CRISPR-associated endonuclease/helicase Cas3|nr:CRISPR-associated helicase Cas3' [Oscillospiraceae bacterium]